MSTYTFSPPELESIWSQACSELQQQLSPAVFNTWVISNPLTGLFIDGETARAVFTCPTAFHATTIRKNLSTQLKTVLDALVGKAVQLEFEVGTPTPKPPVSPTPNQPTSANQSAAFPSAPAPSQPTPTATSAPPASTGASSHAPTPSPAAPTFNSIGSLIHQTKSGSPRVEDLFSPSTLQSVALDRAVVAARQIGLRADFTFETFAVSTTNEMAHAAATAVSNRPGTAYNPLFLYGGVGVGKTHLMHAIGNNILKNNPETRVIYCTGEEFTNEIVNAIQMKRAIKFKERFRTAQVLLIDDVQFIAGKNAVQEEFFHTFNSLIKQASQVVMTSDRPPHEINLLEDRLRSRFEAGLMIDIQQPSFELRTAILLIKASAVNLSIPMEIAQLIASQVDSARKIEGMITSIRSAVELQKKPITSDLVNTILNTEIDKQRPSLKVTPNDVLRAVANHYRVKQIAIRGQQRVAELVKARHVAMFLLKEDLQLPLAEIGRWFSGRDHTSALHAVRKVQKQLMTDDVLQRDISALRMSLTAVSK